MFGNALGNAAAGAIDEAQWKAAQPSVNKQINAAIDNIIGDGSDESSGADQYARSWDASLFGGGSLGGAVGSAAGDPASGNYDLIATGESPKGYPVPVSNTSDPAILDALYKNTTAFVNYERNQGLYGDLPSVPQPWDSQGLIGFNHTLQQMVWPGNGLQTLSAVNVVPTSEMQQDVAAADARQSETEAAWSSWRGSVGGDLAYNAATLGTRGLNDLMASAESVKDVLTDRLSAEQAVTGLGRELYGIASDVAHPIDTYNRAVGAVSDWYGEPSDQQARDIGRFGIDTLVFGGAEGVAAKGLGYIDTLADGFGGAVDALGAGPMYGSRVAQAGMLDVGAVASPATLIENAANLREAFLATGDVDQSLARTIAVGSMHGDGDTLILGRWGEDPDVGEYIDFAKRNGGRWFEVDPSVDRALTQGLGSDAKRTLRLAINREALVNAMENETPLIHYVSGDLFTAPIRTPLTARTMEIQFMRSNAYSYGYVYQGDGVWKYVPASK